MKHLKIVAFLCAGLILPPAANAGKWLNWDKEAGDLEVTKTGRKLPRAIGEARKFRNRGLHRVTFPNLPERRQEKAMQSFLVQSGMVGLSDGYVEEENRYKNMITFLRNELFPENRTLGLNIDFCNPDGLEFATYVSSLGQIFGDRMEGINRVVMPIDSRTDEMLPALSQLLGQYPQIRTVEFNGNSTSPSELFEKCLNLPGTLSLYFESEFLKGLNKDNISGILLNNHVGSKFVTSSASQDMDPNESSTSQYRDLCEGKESRKIFYFTGTDLENTKIQIRILEDIVKSGQLSSSALATLRRSEEKKSLHRSDVYARLKALQEAEEGETLKQLAQEIRDEYI